MNVTRKIKRGNVSYAQIGLVLIHLFIVMLAKIGNTGTAQMLARSKELLEQINGAMWFCDNCS